jgi:hypothetical protein
MTAMLKAKRPDFHPAAQAKRQTAFRNIKVAAGSGTNPLSTRIT